ncbi:hypothetical protein F5Y18DRAFT_374109 [Xylariaceae sp. FL1019]|nr:hypothetical protein F5Y18DRAFT_374109 [Xylariaceae sp. FL1019]
MELWTPVNPYCEREELRIDDLYNQAAIEKLRRVFQPAQQCIRQFVSKTTGLGIKDVHVQLNVFHLDRCDVDEFGQPLLSVKGRRGEGIGPPYSFSIHGKRLAFSGRPLTGWKPREQHIPREERSDSYLDSGRCLGWHVTLDNDQERRYFNRPEFWHERFLFELFPAFKHGKHLRPLAYKLGSNENSTWLSPATHVIACRDENSEGWRLHECPERAYMPLAAFDKVYHHQSRLFQSLEDRYGTLEEPVRKVFFMSAKFRIESRIRRNGDDFITEAVRPTYIISVRTSSDWNQLVRRFEVLVRAARNEDLLSLKKVDESWYDFIQWQLDVFDDVSHHKGSFILSPEYAFYENMDGTWCSRRHQTNSASHVSS